VLLGWLFEPLGLVLGLCVDSLGGGHPLVRGFVRVDGRGDLREPQFLSSY